MCCVSGFVARCAWWVWWCCLILFCVLCCGVVFGLLVCGCFGLASAWRFGLFIVYCCVAVVFWVGIVAAVFCVLLCGVFSLWLLRYGLLVLWLVLVLTLIIGLD